MDTENSEVSLTKAGMDRLENWYLWASKGERAMIMGHYYPRRVSACAHYRSSEVWNDTDSEPLIDEDDAAKVDKALTQLPRHLRTAVTNHYLGRPKIYGTPKDVLDGWVGQAAREIQTRFP
ncbi:MAG: hypothetical protein ABFC67_14820 [Mizugakiibacter sp.]|uniref:hypothetical protein n=1 Tax=Mizugakiibacter sp. TaxID=1972610 RepID=UPI00320C4FE6